MSYACGRQRAEGAALHHAASTVSNGGELLVNEHNAASVACSMETATKSGLGLATAAAVGQSGDDNGRHEAWEQSDVPVTMDEAATAIPADASTGDTAEAIQRASVVAEEIFGENDEVEDDGIDYESSDQEADRRNRKKRWRTKIRFRDCWLSFLGSFAYL